MQARPAHRPPAAPEGRPAHPLIQVGKGMAADLISTIAFAAIYAATHDIYLATGLGIAAGVAEIVWTRRRGRPVDAMQWLVLGLVAVFGAASMATQSPAFIMVKPTLIYGAVGLVMLRPGWLNRYMPAAVQARNGDVTRVFGFVWSGLMFATAAINLALALLADFAVWAWFIGVFPLASKFALIAIQYGATRFIVRRRMRKQGEGSPSAAIPTAPGAAVGTSGCSALEPLEPRSETP